MRDMSLHVMDIAENSIRAGARQVTVRVDERRRSDQLVVVIEDDGAGMDSRSASQALYPFFTSVPGKRVGLGLPLFLQAAREAGGGLSIDSAPGRGTRITAVFALSHPDLKPLGDMEKTMRILRCAHPAVEFRYSHTVDGEQGVKHEDHA